MPTAVEFQAKVEKSMVNMDRLNSIVNGGTTAVTETDNGPVPSIVKLVTDFDNAADAALAGLGNIAAAVTESRDARDQSRKWANFTPGIVDPINYPGQHSALYHAAASRNSETSTIALAAAALASKNLAEQYLNTFPNYYMGASGAPGGNVMAIGLFTGAAGSAIAAGTTLVQTSGYSMVGEGAALYAYDAAATPITTDRTNLLVAPADMTAAPWAPVNPSFPATVTTDTGGFFLIADNNAGYAGWRQSIATVAPVQTVELKIKKDAVPAATRKAILRIHWTGASTKLVDVLIDTMDGNVVDGSRYSSGTSPAFDYGILDMGDYWRVWVTGTAPIGATGVQIRIFPANGPNNSSVGSATGSIIAKDPQLYIGTSDQYVPTINARAEFIAADGRVFKLVREQVVTPRMFGASLALADHTTALQAFYDFVTTNECRLADISGSYAISSSVQLGPKVATKQFIGQDALIALAPMLYLRKFLNQVDITWSARTNYYGYATSTAYADRFCLDAEVFEGCRSFNRSAGGARFSGFKHAGLNASKGNNSFLKMGDVKGFYCGSGSSTAGLSLSATWDTAVHSGFPDEADQFTTINVSTIPEDAVFGRDGVYVWLNGRPYLVTGKTRADGFDGTQPSPGKIKVFPWLDTRVASAGTLDFMFGGLIYINGGDAAGMTGEIEAQLCGAAIASGALYGSKFKISAQRCGHVMSAGLRQFGVHQPDIIEMGYVEANRATYIIPNGQNGDYGRIRINGQHETLTATGVWTFTPCHDQVNFQPTNVPGLQGTKLTYMHRECEYEKASPDNFRQTNTNLLLSPNRAGSYIAEVGVTSRKVEIQPLDSGLKRNLGYSGGRYEARGAGPNGAPTSTITWSATGTTVNGQPSVTFSGFKRAAIFSYEYDPLTGGFLVHLMTGDMAPAAALADGAIAEVNALKAVLRASGLLTI